MQTSKIRHQFYLPDALSRQLDELAAKPGASKSAILTDALSVWLERKAGNALDERFGQRLDRHARIAQRSEATLNAVAEMMDLLILHYLTLNANQPAFDEATARLGRQRYQSFIDVVARKLATNRTVPALVSVDGLKEQPSKNERMTQYSGG